MIGFLLLFLIVVARWWEKGISDALAVALFITAGWVNGYYYRKLGVKG